MKKISILLITLIASMVLIAGINWKKNDSSYKTNPDSRPIIAMRKVKLKEGVSAEVFEKFAVKVASGDYGNLPGVKFYYGKGERGDETDSYILFMEFDSKATRDFYAPVANDNTTTPTEVKKTY